MSLPVGQRIGPYQIQSELGSGGMGIVYRARDVRLGRDVAIKVLHAEYAGDPAAVDRFQREARLASTLSHPHVCSIYDTGDHDGQPFLVMELLQGQSLQKMVHQTPLSLARAVELATEIAEGLEAAHERGIVHRDLKPANIFVTTHGHAKILDFGVAKLLTPSSDAETQAGLTSTGHAVGTVAYMSPEQARGEDVDVRSDLFSFGVVLYEMLTRRPAFQGATAAVIFEAVLNRQPAAVGHYVPDVHVDLERLVARMLSKAAPDRPASAGEVLAELRQIQRGERQHVVPRAGRLSAAPEEASIAVLPFASLSADADDEFLADGITEEIIGALGRMGNLRVCGRASSFVFKGRSPAIADVAARLGVSSVLTGGVRRAGSHLRVTVELSSIDGFQVWSDRFDRTAGDVFALQDDIAQHVAARLRGTLTAGGRPVRSMRRGTANREAHLLYLKGRHVIQQRGDGVLRALESFERAKELDPDFAQAHAGSAEANALLGFYGYAPADRVMPAARAGALRALELDPSLDEAHAPLIMVRFLYERDWAASAAEFDRAMSRNPNGVEALVSRAIELSLIHGRFDEALDLCGRAARLDPLSQYPHTLAGTVHLGAGRFADARLALAQADELQPNSWPVLRLTGLAQAGEGRIDDALETLERARAVSHDHPWTIGNLMDVNVIAGRTDQVRRWALAGLDLAKTKYVQPSVLGGYCTGLGRMDEAFAWFERACEERDFLPVLNHTLFAVEIWSDPVKVDRWKAMMRRLGVVPADTPSIRKQGTPQAAPPVA